MAEDHCCEKLQKAVSLHPGGTIKSRLSLPLPLLHWPYFSKVNNRRGSSDTGEATRRLDCLCSDGVGLCTPCFMCEMGKCSEASDRDGRERPEI